MELPITIIKLELPFILNKIGNLITIREYTKDDKEQVLHLLRLNTPRYFAPEEEEDLIHYLDQEIDHYFVLQVDDKIVGSGGINFADNATTGKISWDILHPEYQGRSLGTQLLDYRIEKLRSIKSIQRIIVRTSQVAYPFYQKRGFTLVFIEKDYWSPGFDLYFMEYSNPNP